jgi:hypothetical protein
MTALSSIRSRSYLIGLIVLLAVGISGYFTYQRVLLERFRNAMARHDYGRAQELWKKGVIAAKNDPYAELMRILDRLNAVRDIEVKDWNLQSLLPNGDTNCYAAQLDIASTNARFGVILSWKGEKWALVHDYPEIPSSVRTCLEIRNGVSH